MKKVYYFDEETKEYIGCDAAMLDPLETEITGKNVYLLPAFATFKKPLEEKDGHVSVWDGKKWIYEEDNRNVEYWSSDQTFYDTPFVMKELGKLPDGSSTIRPEKSIEILRKEKIEELKCVRITKETSPIEYNGKLWDCDSVSKERIITAFMSLKSGLINSIVWTDSNNDSFEMDIKDFEGIIQAMTTRNDLLHKMYQSLRDVVKSSNDKSEIENIKWTENI